MANTPNSTMAPPGSGCATRPTMVDTKIASNRQEAGVMPSEQPVVIERSDVQLAAAHVGRAEALLKGNDADGAMRELTRAAYLDPYSARAHEVMARAYLAKGEKDKAAKDEDVSTEGVAFAYLMRGVHW